MDENNFSTEENSTVIRYNVLYTVGLFIFSIVLMGIFLSIAGKNWDKYFLILSLILLTHGIYALVRNKYVRVDKKSKIIKIYDTPVFWVFIQDILTPHSG